jgi:hypothetical protein
VDSERAAASPLSWIPPAPPPPPFSSSWKERESGKGKERSNKGAVRVVGEVLGSSGQIDGTELPLSDPTIAPYHGGLLFAAA